jgi:plastocyanin
VKTFTTTLLSEGAFAIVEAVIHDMKMKLQIGTLLAVACALQTASAEDITGKITLNGSAPAEKPLPMDPTCGKLLPTGSKPMTSFYVVGAGNGLGDVVVYLKGMSGKSTGASAKPLMVDQKGCLYEPYVATVQTGQTISVANLDPVLHNIHPTPKPGTGNKEANKAQLPKGPTLDFVFPDEEMFLRFKCDVHPWMFAYMSVFDHPYHATSDKDGNFKISGVPAGKYTLVVDHRKAGTTEKEIEVTADGAKASFVLDAK